MSIQKVALYGNPCLSQKTELITKLTPEILALVNDMFETMTVENGVGLAAPQINQNIKLFIMNTNNSPHICINPEIISESVEDQAFHEGCLSLPGIQQPVYRPAKIKVSYINHKGIQGQYELEGLDACVFQHELDHLNGILFVNRIPLKYRLPLLPQLAEIKAKNNRKV